MTSHWSSDHPLVYTYNHFSQIIAHCSHSGVDIDLILYIVFISHDAILPHIHEVVEVGSNVVGEYVTL